MKNLHEQWLEAIEIVLAGSKEGINCDTIAGKISEKGLKPAGSKSENISKAVWVALRKDMDEKELGSKFDKFGKGNYILRKYKQCTNFGLYWDRSKIDWKTTTPDLLGWSKSNEVINFKDQIGIYLLHDDRRTIYVGKAEKGKSTIIKRLKDHTTDRLAGKWQKFSWFGIYPIDENGKIMMIDRVLSERDMVSYLESVLIEVLELPQNRKSGDFKGVEYTHK